MPSPHFNNFGKKAKDLFKKQYDYKNEIKVTSKAAGVKLESGGYQAKGLNGYTKANWTDAYLGDIEIEAHSGGVAKGQFKLNGVTDGVNVTVSGAGTGSMAVETTYEQDLISCNVKATRCPKGSTGIVASAVLGLEGVSVGGQVTLDLANMGSPKDYNLGAEYTQKDLTASLVTSNKGEDITASYYQTVSKSLKLGSSMLVKPEAGTRLFTFGTDYALDSATTVKAKADSNGIIGTSITHTLADPNAKLCFSAQFDGLSSDVLSAQKFGVSVNLGDF